MIMGHHLSPQCAHLATPKDCRRASLTNQISALVYRYQHLASSAPPARSFLLPWELLVKFKFRGGREVQGVRSVFFGSHHALYIAWEDE